MELFSNNASTTLSSGISNSATSLVVASAVNFPTAGNFRILVESELMLVTAVSGTTFTVTRGAESTTAVSHSAGVVVSHVLTSGALAGFRSDSITTGTFASRPTEGTAGRIYQANDASIISLDDGTAWRDYGLLCGPFTKPPSVSTLTEVNSTTGGFHHADLSYGFYLATYADTGLSENVKMLVKNIPNGSNYSLTLAIMAAWSDRDYSSIGPIIYDGTKLIFYGPIYGRNQGTWDARHMNSVTSYNSDLNNDTVPPGNGPQVLWSRITNDGTTRKYFMSFNGFDWFQTAHEAHNNFLTETQYGVFIWTFTATPVFGHVLSWVEA